MSNRRAEERRRQKAAQKQRITQARYDVGMLRDFIEHLGWELACNQWEWRTKYSGEVNRELSEPLGRLAAKYGCPLLLTTAISNRSEFSEDELRRYCEIASKEREEQYGKYVEALEVLEPLFREVLACINFTYREGAWPVIAVDPREYLKDRHQ